jgi:hypothetical protein
MECRLLVNIWHTGHTLSEFDSVMGIVKVENTYCDFTKLPSDAGTVLICRLEY